MTYVFSKPFTQQEPIDEVTISRVGEILRGGRLHRYNVADGEIAEASLLESEYAQYQGARYCLACSSGGYALSIALRAAGLTSGQKVLANAYTLAPVPGAIHNAGGVPVFVEVDQDWHIDIDDLKKKAESSEAGFLMLSHMRGHIADMDAVMAICEAHNICLIEDCAHTMGAKWKGIRSGNFGTVSAFSAQTYKHINSGEGGLLTTDDPEIAARAIIMSGSYMLYENHGAIPEKSYFDAVKLETPNFSGRMDNMRAAILRGQIRNLDENVGRWNARYRVIETGLASSDDIEISRRKQHEQYVGSSIQFRPQLQESEFELLIEKCANRGVDIKWFGALAPKAFTSRYDSWRYLGEQPVLNQTLSVLSKTCDMRVPLTFDLEDCKQVAQIVVDEVRSIADNRAADLS